MRFAKAKAVCDIVDRIQCLSGLQARAALQGILDGLPLEQAIRFVETYPPAE